VCRAHHSWEGTPEAAMGAECAAGGPPAGCSERQAAKAGGDTFSGGKESRNNAEKVGLTPVIN